MNYEEKLYKNLRFSMKKLFEKSRVTHGESRGYSRRKHTLNKICNIFEIVLKFMPLNTLYTKEHTQ